MRGLELELLCDLILLAFDYFTIELDQISAFGADQMVVMLMIVHMLISHAAIAKAFLPRQATFRQEFKRAVDSSEADTRVCGLDPLIQLLSTRMALSIEKHIEDQFALRSPFEP